jgi:hypothetical protein
MMRQRGYGRRAPLVDERKKRNALCAAISHTHGLELPQEPLMGFRISGLPAATFAGLIGLPDQELAAHQAVRVVADRRPGFPCRVSLRDAQPGERLLLLNYEHHAVAGPYRSRYAIYVRENAAEARLAVGEVPEVLQHGRLLSLRAFSAAGMLLDADVVEAPQLTAAIDRLLAPGAVAYLHVHNARPGCFAARVDRA